jgi:hypothetical protein
MAIRLVFEQADRVARVCTSISSVQESVQVVHISFFHKPLVPIALALHRVFTVFNLLKVLSSLATVTHGVVNTRRKALLDCWSKGTPISFPLFLAALEIYLASAFLNHDMFLR